MRIELGFVGKAVLFARGNGTGGFEIDSTLDKTQSGLKHDKRYLENV